MTHELRRASAKAPRKAWNRERTALSADAIESRVGELTGHLAQLGRRIVAAFPVNSSLAPPDDIARSLGAGSEARGWSGPIRLWKRLGYGPYFVPGRFVLPPQTFIPAAPYLLLKDALRYVPRGAQLPLTVPTQFHVALDDRVIYPQRVRQAAGSNSLAALYEYAKGGHQMHGNAQLIEARIGRALRRSSTGHAWPTAIRAEEAPEILRQQLLTVSQLD
jgi:hypothetical protein